MNLPASFKFSNKHVQIDRTYAKIVIAVAAACSAVIFCLVVSNALIKQISYQNKAIGLKNKSADQLKKNVNNVTPLVNSYEAFDSATESVLGTPANNTKIVLDALPSKYDFPALATSLEYIISQSGMVPKTISGTDNELGAEQNNANPEPIEIPFTIEGAGSYEQAKALLKKFERSIRPFSVGELTFSGSDNNMTVAIAAKTYYQPEKKLEFKQTIITNGSVKAKKTTAKTTATTGSTN